MREIKFRAWDKQEKKIVWVSSINWFEEMLEAQKPYYVVHRLDRFELMQFTGLKDKNGKEIYEGDVVEMQEEYSGKGRPSYRKMRGEIFWDIEAACFLARNKDGWQSGIGYPLDAEVNLTEVIGNVFENPELLKN